MEDTPTPENQAGSGIGVFVAGVWAVLLGLLAIGFLFPWTPPEGDAVLRVIAPEGENYRIIWGPFVIAETGTIGEGRTYEDHAVPAEAGDASEGLNVVVQDITFGGEDLERDGNVGAVLFVSGKTAACTRALGSTARLYWYPYQGLGDPVKRALCGSYRYSRLL